MPGMTAETKMTWHAVTEKAALLGLGTALQNGLDDSEAARRSQQFGRNELSDQGMRSPWSIFWGQLTGTLVVILILAALVTPVGAAVPLRSK